MGNGYLVSSEFTFADKYYNDIAVWNDRIISVWQDKRNGDYDIFCNIRSYSNPDSTVSIHNISTEIPSDFRLLQNYPNPFNNQTSIVFEITRKQDYKLEIYNTLGSLVDRIDYSNLTQGKYIIKYDASKLTSGVYQYILSSPNERLVKSFVLLK